MADDDRDIGAADDSREQSLEEFAIWRIAPTRKIAIWRSLLRGTQGV
jgi:hypothetical protein